MHEPPPRYDRDHPWGPAVNLRALRRARGWTAAKLASVVGISTPFMCDIERGTRGPSLDVAQRIATALEADIPLPYPPVPAGYVLIHQQTLAYLLVGVEYLASHLIEESGGDAGTRDRVVAALDGDDTLIEAYDEAVRLLEKPDDE